MMPRMTFYTFKDTEGNVHVQNAVMGMSGQHHVHTPEDFEDWRKRGEIADKDVKDLSEECHPCGCGMKPGEVCNGWPDKS